MRKTLSILLAASMVAATLAGCGSKPAETTAAPKAEETTTAADAAKTEETTADAAESTGDPVTLKLAIFKGGYGDAFWTAVTDAYTKANPNVTFEIDADPSIGEKVNSSMLAGDIPDFIYCPSSNPSGLARRLIKDQALADLTDVFEGPLKGKILDGFLDTSLSQPYGDGKVYLAPLYYTANGLFYNATLFEEAGLNVPTTWDEFFALGDEIKGKDIAGKSDRSLFTYQGGNAPGYMETVIIPLLTAKLGVEGMNDCFTYKEGAWDKEGVKEVFDLVAKLGSGGYLLPNTTGIDHTTAQTAVMNGSALFVPCGSWIVGEMADITGEEINGKPFAWGFAPVPAMDGTTDKYLMSSVEEVYIPAASENVDAAKDFLAFLYSDEAIKLNAEKTGGIPPVVGATDLTKDILDPMILSTFQSFDNGYKPYIGGFAAVDSEVVPKSEFYGHVNAVVDGKETVDDWVAACDKLSDTVRDSLVTAE